MRNKKKQTLDWFPLSCDGCHGLGASKQPEEDGGVGQSIHALRNIGIIIMTVMIIMIMTIMMTITTIIIIIIIIITIIFRAGVSSHMLLG